MENPIKKSFQEDVKEILDRSAFGKPLSLSLFEEIAKKQEERVREILSEFTKRLDEFSEKVDEAYFKTGEFQSLIQKVISRLSREHQKEKLYLACNLLARNVIEGNTESYELDSYVMALIEQLTSVHFAALFCVENKSGKDLIRADEVAGQLSIPGQHAQSVLDHLASLGLLHASPGMARLRGFRGSAGNVNVNFSFAISPTGVQVLTRVQEVRGETLS